MYRLCTTVYRVNIRVQIDRLIDVKEKEGFSRRGSRWADRGDLSSNGPNW